MMIRMFQYLRTKYVSCTQVTEQKTDRLVNSTRKILENIYKQAMLIILISVGGFGKLN